MTSVNPDCCILPRCPPPPSDDEETVADSEGGSSGAERAEGGRLGYREEGAQPDGDDLSRPESDEVRHGRVQLRTGSRRSLLTSTRLPKYSGGWSTLNKSALKAAGSDPSR